MVERDSNDVAPACPRCGYDLRGAIATWRETCPLQGTCAECGLAMRWAEVLVPEKFEPPWCVEFVQLRRRFGWASANTFARSARPFRFWSTLKMSMPLRPWRLAVYVALLLMPVLASAVVVQVVAAVRVRYELQQELTMQFSQMKQQAAGLKAMLDAPGYSELTRGRAAQQLAQFRIMIAAPWVVNHSYAAAIAEAVLFPWRSQSSGTMGGWGGAVQGYPAPRDLHATLLGRYAQRTTPLNRKDPAITLACVVVAIWIATTMPLAFVLLPVSRRRARVRWSHLFRVAGYGMVIPSAAVAAMLLCVALGCAFDGLQPAAHATAHTLGRFGILGATIVWWAAAIRCYLHIPHAWAVPPVLAFLLIVVLVAAVYVLGIGLQ